MNRTKRKKIVVIELVLLAGILSCMAVFYKRNFQTETPKQKTEKPQVHRAKKIKKTQEKKPEKKAEEMAEGRQARGREETTNSQEQPGTLIIRTACA